MSTIEPVALPAPSEEPKAEKTVVLFSIGDTNYHVPAQPKANLAIKYLFQAKTLGDDVAAANLLNELLGDEGFAALANYDDLKPEQLEDVMLAAQKHTMGALEQGRGKSGRGSRK